MTLSNFHEEDSSGAQGSLHLHPMASRTSSTIPTSAPAEALTAAGPTIMAEEEEGPKPHRSQLVFKRLKREMPLPTTFQSRCMLGTLFLVMFLAGWNDASQGPLLPSLQAKYQVNYLIISIIWIANFVGFMTSGVTNVIITDRFGFGIAAPFGTSMQALAYILMASGGPYPLFVIAYVFNGFGLGLQDAQVNSLATRLPDANTKMFLLHAVYGFGATVSPLISTEFVKRVPKVYLYFWVSLGLSGITVFALILAFRLRTEDQIIGGSRDHIAQQLKTSANSTPPSEKARKPATPETPVADTQGPKALHEPQTAGNEQEKDGQVGVKKGSRGSGGKMRRIMRTPAVHYMAFYMTIYVGVEVTLGGWITSFLLSQRGGNDNSGYVTTGYFAGLTLGRVVLIPVTAWIGKNNCMYLLSILAIILEVLVWTIKNEIANGVFFALVGFVLGPMYPIVMMVVVDIIPGELQSGTIGWIASLGQAGSAMMPFITGGISERYGVWILQPLIVAFLGFSLILWFFVPRPKGLRV